jgi:hypothetical protein
VTITVGASQGHFELNVFKPVMAQRMLQSIRLLADASRSSPTIASRAFAPTKRIRELMERSLMLVTALAPKHRLRQGGRDRQGGPQERHHAARGGGAARPRHRRGVRPAGAAGAHDRRATLSAHLPKTLQRFTCFLR